MFDVVVTQVFMKRGKYSEKYSSWKEFVEKPVLGK
jgi:hypothetical protein